MLWKTKKKLKILYVATELYPFARVGGMGSVMHDLPIAMKKIGHDARVIIPKYKGVGDGLRLSLECDELELPTDNTEKEQFIFCKVWKYLPENKSEDPVTTYFLDNSEYFGNRSNIYGYADDPIRWTILCKATLEFLKISDWVPDIIVANDWHTGLLPNFIKTKYKEHPKLKDVVAMLSIHNLHFQGNFKHQFTDEMDFDDGRSPIPAFEDGRLLQINGMRRGIMCADIINTVSPNYAKEILTPQYGEGLHELLIERKNAVFGILNGINYDVWNPEKDSLLTENFSVKELDKRVTNRNELARRLNLEIDEHTFVLGIVSRMSAQKGFDLLDPVLKSLLRELNIALVVVGEGDQRYMEFFNELKEKFPKRVAVNFRFDPELPHLVFAGIDSILIPSKFEPSGLTQMEAMHYGAVPIVRNTGGLADTVSDYNPKNKDSNGFVFNKFDSFSMLIAIMRAYENFKNKDVWSKLQVRGMERDFSWEHSAKEYEKIMTKGLEFHKNNVFDTGRKITIKE